MIFCGQKFVTRFRTIYYLLVKKGGGKAAVLRIQDKFWDMHDPFLRR